MKALDNIIKEVKCSKVRPPENLSFNIMTKIKVLDGRTSTDKFNFRKYLLRPALASAFLFFVTVSILYFTKPKTINITFVLYKPDAFSVQLAGDFNNWNPSVGVLENKNGYWMTTVNLEPGQYKYMFVVNEKEWIPDPANSEYVISAFGGENSVVEVGNSI